MREIQSPARNRVGSQVALLFVNDTGNDITSNTKLFADDTLLHGLVHNSDDEIRLQSDPDKLVERAKLWQMAFNPSKCHVYAFSEPSGLLYTRTLRLTIPYRL